MKAENQTTTMSVKLSPETKAKLLHLSKMKDRSPHWLMNKAITEYVASFLCKSALYRRAR